MKKTLLSAILLFLICITNYAQNHEVSLKVAILPWGNSALHYSFGLELPVAGSFTTQTTYNYLEIFDSESELEEINKRNALMQDIRYFISPKEAGKSVRLYVFLFPRVSFNQMGYIGSTTNPVHDELEYGGGGGAGFKFGAKRRLYTDFNLGYFYRTTETEYKTIDRVYDGWLPRINLHLCYKIGFGNVNESNKEK